MFFINLGPSLAAGKYIGYEHGKASVDLQVLFSQG